MSEKQVSPRMYTRDLDCPLRLRVSQRDYAFLVNLADEKHLRVSDVVRNIIGEYRRSLDTIAALNDAIALVRSQQGGEQLDK